MEIKRGIIVSSEHIYNPPHTNMALESTKTPASIRRYIYGAKGYINRILSSTQAEVSFDLEGTSEMAYLRKECFYHNAQLLPDNVPLNQYISNGMQVRFTCHTVKRSDVHPFGWLIVMCWNDDHKPGIDIQMIIGMVCVKGNILNVKEDNGVLNMTDTAGKLHTVYFEADKVYNSGKRILGQSLLQTLSINDKVFFDALPCIPEENDFNCNWIATCVFKGSRPELCEIVSAEDKSKLDSIPCIMQAIMQCITNPRAIFITGKGILFDILDDEFGILLGQFQYNIYQPILFHRKNAYLFKMSLADSNLSDVLAEGDRMKFIAVSAPPNFLTSWIAVQVAVCDNQEYDIPQFNPDGCFPAIHPVK